MAYGEIVFFCFAVIAVMFVALRSSMSRLDNRNILTQVFSMVLLSLLFDFSMKYFDGSTHAWADVANKLVCASYLVSSIWVVFLSWRYVGYSMDLDFWNHKNKLLIHAIPGLIGSLLVIVSIWTGWVFGIDESNHYFRGPQFLVFILCSYVYLVWQCVVAGQRIFLKRYYADRMLYISLSSFGAFPLLGVTCKMFFPEIPWVTAAMVLSMFLAFITTQSRMISTDPLTKLNNRGQLNAFLESKLRQTIPDRRICFYVLDIDKFKHINDTYGHMEGDRALNQVAKVLKKTCGPRGCFISRFGGDEFNLVAMLRPEDKPEDIVAVVREELALESAALPYRLTVSIGYAINNGTDETLPSLFGRADEMLYAEKKAKR